MSSRPWANCFALSAVMTLPFACSRGPELAIMGDSFRARQAEPLPRDSALFDGATLRLRGARGETLGVQVLVRGPEQQAIDLELPAEVSSVQGFDVRSLDVREPSTSLYGPSRGAGPDQTPSWPSDEPPWEAARERVFDAIAWRCDARP